MEGPDLLTNPRGLLRDRERPVNGAFGFLSSGETCSTSGSSSLGWIESFGLSQSPFEELQGARDRDARAISVNCLSLILTVLTESDKTERMFNHVHN